MKNLRFFVTFGVLSSAVLAQVSDPAGLTEIRVNPEHPAVTYISSVGHGPPGRPQPEVAADAAGRFVVVWQYGDSIYPDEIYGRRFSAGGDALTGEVHLATGRVRGLTSDSEGNFLLVWAPYTDDGGYTLRRFSPDGEPLTDELPFDTFDDIASDDEGNFVIVRSGDDGDLTGIFAERFSGDGMPLTGEIQVHALTMGRRARPAVASYPDGSFVVVWNGDGGDGQNDALFARRFTSAGEPLTGELPVSSSTTGVLLDPDVATAGGAGFVVAWREVPETEDSEAIRAARFDSESQPLTKITLASMTTRHPEGRFLFTEPVVRAHAGGEALVTWAKDFNGVSPGGIEPVEDLGYFGRHIGADGSVLGGAFRIRPEMKAFGERVSLASGNQGDYVAVYRHEHRVLARRLPADARAGTVHLEPGTLDVVESNVRKELTILRSGGALGEVSFDLRSEELEATSGEDFVPVSARMTISEEESWLPQPISIELLDDLEPEDDERFLVRLENLDDGLHVYGERDSAEVRIVDYDYNRPETLPVPLSEEILVSNESGAYSVDGVAVSPGGEIAVIWSTLESVFARFYDPEGMARGPGIELPGLDRRRSRPGLAYDGKSGFLILSTDKEDRFQVSSMTVEGEVVDTFEIDVPRPCTPVGAFNCRITGLQVAQGHQGRVPAVWTFGSPRDVLWLGWISAEGSLERVELADRVTEATLTSARDGSLFVAWKREGEYQGRRYDSGGKPMSETFRLGIDDAIGVRFSLADDGGLVGTWEAPHQKIEADRLSLATHQHRSFTVPDFPYDTFDSPRVATGPAGHFIIVWNQGNILGADGDGPGVFAKRFNRMWGPLGGEFRVNVTNQGRQYGHDVTIGPDGSWVVAYQSEDLSDPSEPDRFNVFLRRFAPFHCVADEDTLCLLGDRYRLELTWRDSAGHTGRGRSVSLTDKAGYFYFFGPENVEVVVKALDGRHANGKYWIFFGSLTNVAYTMTVTDTMTGQVREYTNPLGTFASVADDEAFPGDDLGWERVYEEPVPVASPSAAQKESACAMDGTHLCLNDHRFEVAVEWRDYNDRTGIGQAVALTGDTGYFYFFGPKNVEIVVKVLDGRAINGKFWVFYGALSTVEYTITVRDTLTGNVKTYHNPLYGLASVGDTEALPGAQ